MFASLFAPVPSAAEAEVWRAAAILATVAAFLLAVRLVRDSRERRRLDGMLLSEEAKRSDDDDDDIEEPAPQRADVEALRQSFGEALGESNARIARLERRLRDVLGRELEVEFVDSHGNCQRSERSSSL